MKFCVTGTLAALFLVCRVFPLTAETIILKSGREVEIVDGKISEKEAEDLHREAEGLFKKGRFDLASDYWQLLVDQARGGVVSRAKAARGRIKQIEYGSFVVLRSGIVLKGKIKANLRTDLLGLEGKEEIPLWQVGEIAVEYHPGYSRVSKTFYPLTLLEIRFRAGEIKSSRVTREIELLIERDDGAVTKALLGKEYEILRPQDLGGQIEALTRERTIKVVLYPDLKNYQ